MKVENFEQGLRELADRLKTLALEMESAAKRRPLEKSDRCQFGNRLLSIGKRVTDTGDALIKFDAELALSPSPPSDR